MSLVALAHRASSPLRTRRTVRDAAVIVLATAVAALLALHDDVIGMQRSLSGERVITTEEALVLANLFTAGLVVLCLRHFLDERRRLLASLSGDASARTTARAFTDLSTGISNRRHLELECREALAAGRDATLLVVDVTGADEIDAQYGQDEADRVLAILARRLRAAVDTSDIVARLEGGVFAVLAKAGASAEVARDVGAIVARTIEEPVLIDRRAYRLGASIGATSVTPLDREGEALGRAGIAVARARGRGRLAISFLDPASAAPRDPRSAASSPSSISSAPALVR